MTTPTTISFDRIASSYDTVRAHPQAVAAQIGRAIAAVAGPGARVLELGVGTGRIALPLAEAGCRVAGVDIALEMLRVAQRSQRRAIHEGHEGRQGHEGYQAHQQTDLRAPRALRGSVLLAQGDIAALPFAAGAFDAVLAVHVLHLVADWRGALAEAVRALRPGGAFVMGRDWRDPQSCAGRMRSRLREVVMEILPSIKPPAAGAAVPQALGRLGMAPEGEVTAATWTSSESPAGVLAEMASRSDAETWVLDDDTLDEALRRLRSWAERQYADLDAPELVERRFVLSVARNVHQPQHPG